MTGLQAFEKVMTKLLNNELEKPMDLRELFDKMIYDKEHGKDRAGNIRYIRTHMNQNFKHFSKLGITKHTELTTDTIDYIIRAEREKGNSNGTINNRIEVLNTMLNHSISNKLITMNPIKNYGKQTEIKEKKRDILSTELQYKIMKYYDNLDTRTTSATGRKNLQDKVIISIFHQTGMRTSELRQLRTEHLDKDDFIIHITADISKTRTERRIPINENLWADIKRHINTDKTRTYIFENIEKRTIYHENYFTKSVCSRLKKGLNYEGTITPYMFRHTLATHLCHNTENYRYVMYVMGHTDIQTTMKYVHDNNNYLVSMNEKLDITKHTRELGKKLNKLNDFEPIILKLDKKNDYD